jgi:hypothetical protein
MIRIWRLDLGPVHSNITMLKLLKYHRQVISIAKFFIDEPPDHAHTENKLKSYICRPLAIEYLCNYIANRVLLVDITVWVLKWGSLFSRLQMLVLETIFVRFRTAFIFAEKLICVFGTVTIFAI